MSLGTVVTVFSTKGGAGKSVIAVNLAVVLAMRSERPVCLVDADLQFGDIAVMLKLAPQHTIVDAVASLDRLDATLLQSLHDAASAFWLARARRTARAGVRRPDRRGGDGEDRRDRCARLHATSSSTRRRTSTTSCSGLIEVSDQVLLVAGLDVPNIKNVKIGLQTLRLLNTPKEKLRLGAQPGELQGQARCR